MVTTDQDLCANNCPILAPKGLIVYKEGETIQPIPEPVNNITS